MDSMPQPHPPPQQLPPGFPQLSSQMPSMDHFQQAMMGKPHDPTQQVAAGPYFEILTNVCYISTSKKSLLSQIQPNGNTGCLCDEFHKILHSSVCVASPLR